MAVIYLLLFIAPQVLIYLYLRDRLPDATRPRQAHAARATLAAVFIVFNFPWIFVARRVLFGSVWGLGRIPYLGPWIAWQMLGWIFCGLVTAYLLMKGVWWLWQHLRGARYAVTSGGDSATAEAGSAASATADRAPRTVSRRQFLARATYTYAAVGAATSGYGIWNAYRLPVVTRRTLFFKDLPPAFDGLRLLHLTDLHAGIHMEREKMVQIVAQANALGADLILHTGDMIDISPSYIPDYVRAFRDLEAPLGVITTIGNHDYYTGERQVITGVRDTGSVFLRNEVHVIERGGATLALLGIDDPQNWMHDDPQAAVVDLTLRRTPPDAFKILLAHRPGAFDSAAPRGIPLTLSGHIHGGQFALPLLGISAGSLITKYVMGRFEKQGCQLYVSRGIGVVGVPIRVFVPPEIALLELRRA
jgi:predicted MPP superfamily phosphohydrolase